jgi:hypothetical protein
MLLSCLAGRTRVRPISAVATHHDDHVEKLVDLRQLLGYKAWAEMSI